MKLRVPGGQRNFVMFLLVAVGAFAITLFVSPAEEVPSEQVASSVGASPSAPLLPEPSSTGGSAGVGAQPSSPAGHSVSDLHAYALPLLEVQGLPPDVSPGAVLQLWVAWEPPVTEKPRVQKLFGGARVGRIIPPTVAEAPTTVELLVPEREVPELLFADRHGSLSATVIPQ